MNHLEWHPRGMGPSRYADENSSQQVWNRDCVGSFHFFPTHVRNTGVEEHTWKRSEMQSSHEKRLWLFLFSLLLNRPCKRISYGTSLHLSGVWCLWCIQTTSLDMDSCKICKAVFGTERPLKSEVKGLILIITNKSYSSSNKGIHSFLHEKPCIF